MLSLPKTIGVGFVLLTASMGSLNALAQDEGPVELLTSIDIATSQGVAGVPAVNKDEAKAGGSAPGMDLYTWDVKGENRLVNIAKAKRRGLIDKIYPTPKHLLLTIHQNALGQIKRGNSNCTLVVLTKASGALTCIANVRLSDRIAEWANKPVVQTNASGDKLIFSGFPGNGGGYEDLFLLDMSANPATVKNLTGDSNYYEEDYAMNDVGDILIKSAGQASRSLKAVKNGGTLQNLAGSGGGQPDCLTNGIGANNDHFYALNYTGSGNSHDLVRVKKDGSGNFQMTAILSGQTEIDGFNCQVTIKGQNFLGFFGEKNGKGLLFIYDDKADNLTDTWTTLEIPDMKIVSGAAANAEHIFIYGEDALGSTSIQKYEIATNTFSTLVPHNKFVITDIRGPAAGHLVMIAEQMSDSSYISARIRISDGQVTPVNIKLPAVRQLIPLN